MRCTAREFISHSDSAIFRVSAMRARNTFFKIYFVAAAAAATAVAYDKCRTALEYSLVLRFANASRKIYIFFVFFLEG